MEKFRWEKEDKYISIEGGMSTDLNEAVLSIKSSISIKDLPLELRKQIPQSNETLVSDFINSVKSWAEKNSFEYIELTTNT